jgi:hypothetical protein
MQEDRDTMNATMMDYYRHKMELESDMVKLSMPNQRLRKNHYFEESTQLVNYFADNLPLFNQL